MATAWFESVAVAERRAKRRLPKSVYSALIAGSEAGVTLADNVAAFGELGFAPHVADLPADARHGDDGDGPGRSRCRCSSRRPACRRSIPDGEVAVARAAAARGTAMGLSSFASKPVEEVVAANPQTFFQMYWCGSREQIAGARGARPRRGRDRADRHARLDVLAPPRLGQSGIPEQHRPQGDGAARARRSCVRPAWLADWARAGGPTRPDRPEPDARPARRPPTFFGAYGEWMQTPHRRPGRTCAGCASSGTARSCSRASPASTTPAAPSTSA